MIWIGAEWIYISELETLGQVKIGNQENFWIADASDAEWIYTYPQSWKLWARWKLETKKQFWIADASDAEWIYIYPQSWKLWVKSRWREAQKLETKKQVCIADASGNHVHLL